MHYLAECSFLSRMIINNAKLIEGKVKIHLKRGLKDS